MMVIAHTMNDSMPGRSICWVLLSCLILSACATTAPKQSKEAAATPNDKEQSAEEKASTSPEKDTVPEHRSAEKKATVTKEKDDKKAAAEEPKEELRDKNYDGTRYVGPAQDEFKKGVELYFSKGCDTAIKEWTTAQKTDELNGSIAYNMALCYERSGKIAEARTWYEKAITAKQEQVQALYNLVLLDAKKGAARPDLYRKLAEGVPDAVVRNNFLAWFSLKSKRTDEAITYAKAALKEDEMNVEAMVALGTAYYQKEMFELAEMILSTAEQINPNNFKLQRIYGFLEYQQGNKQRATEHFQKAKKINPELPEVSNMIAILAMEIEDFVTAKNELEFALKIAPDLIEAKMNLAIALKGMKEYKQARALLMELEKSPDLPKEMLRDILYNLAILHLDADIEGDGQTARLDTAVQYFNKYLATVDKRDKVERKRIDDYMKEAQVEKKKIEAYLKMKQKMEAKRKKEAEEEKRYQQFLKDFDTAKTTDTIEAYAAFLEKYPDLDPEDEKGKFARDRIEALKNGAPGAVPEATGAPTSVPTSNAPSPSPEGADSAGPTPDPAADAPEMQEKTGP